MDPFDMSRVEETARRMLDRYSTWQKASDMACFHACDYPRDSRQRSYWRAVSTRIMQIANGRLQQGAGR